MMTTNIHRTVAALTLCALSTACAGSQPPHGKLTDAKASVQAADAMGARQEPQAALHLKMAQDAIADAEKRIEQGDNEGAVPVLDRALADAKLARALTQEATTKRSADQAVERLNGLERELAKRDGAVGTTPVDAPSSARSAAGTQGGKP